MTVSEARQPPVWASGRRTLRAVVGLAIVLVALTIADAWLHGYDPATKLDLRFGYDRTEVVDLFRAYGPSGRLAYGVNLAVDTVYPLVLAAAVILVSARAFGGGLRWPWIAPAAFAVLDVVENLLLGVALLRFPEVPSGLVSVTSLVTRVKLVSFAPTVVLGVIAVAVLGYRVFSGRARRRGAPALPGRRFRRPRPGRSARDRHAR